ncbi:Nucleotide-binding, alpha-beta plait [Cordyceps fumosorosea ARSEF 2679]|uniref:Nucleotide-binding, alpha-beta plait n=1 Tax=Cordyceps fumosorosea (strain ARSEF 2679) TaxID=1081104 RepID=A0A167QI72_CORFA|nr:Nucleotide-binding, alpha-beta plait [Cordyceps fumosorosea ARSEF 2679]OAA57664.1 Nucleotide-binding, alpha-beta plait [Cordyceps fumosorosea ARSEF 2679]
MSSDEKEMSPVDAAPETNASKRKADVEEIEVDLAAPEPPSKRARRAMKKGKSVTSKAKKDNNNDDLEDEDAASKDNKDDKDGKAAARSEHGVWIGNLRFTVTPKELRQWLVDNAGGVLTSEMITRVKLPASKAGPGGRAKDEPPTNRGFAYVDFSDVGGKLAAIALSETEWHGRRLLIKDSKSFEGRPKKEPEEKEGGTARGQQAAAAVDPNASRKLFVGNMSFKTTEEDVRRNFDKCGEIEWVKVATFEDTGKCKGYGWVKFKEAEAAAWAVKGFVKIKEAVETEDDFRDDDDKDGGDEDDDAAKDEEGDDDDEAKTKKKKPAKQQQQQKQFKTRKWYVNRMLGRELKLELAEDDQSRYRKRFGKERPADAAGANGRGRGPRENGGGEERRHKKADGPVDLQEARLMGKVVEHTGTKVTFD